MGKSEEQTAIRLLRDLADLQNGAPLERNRKEYEGTMQEIYDLLNYVDSQSSTTSDVLQEGDWFIGTEEDYRKVFIEIANEMEHKVHCAVCVGFIAFSTLDKLISHPKFKKTQLTPEEFIRRADNTFKTK